MAANDKRRRLRHVHGWHAHPAVRSGEQLTLGERAADRLRNGMGSWGFVFGALAFLLGWMASSGLGLDKPPYILLNLILSCLAALQGAILLIAAKRSDQVAAEQATHHYQETTKLDDVQQQMHELLKQNTALTEQVAALVAQQDGQ